MCCSCSYSVSLIFRLPYSKSSGVNDISSREIGSPPRRSWHAVQPHVHSMARTASAISTRSIRSMRTFSSSESSEREMPSSDAKRSASCRSSGGITPRVRRPATEGSSSQ